MAIDFDYVDETAGVRLVYQPGVKAKDVNSPASCYSWQLDAFMHFTEVGGVLRCQASGSHRGFEDGGLSYCSASGVGCARLSKWRFT